MLIKNLRLFSMGFLQITTPPPVPAKRACIHRPVIEFKQMLPSSVNGNDILLDRTVQWRDRVAPLGLLRTGNRNGLTKPID